MSRCEFVSDKLSGYLDDELTQQQSQEIKVHLEACDSCNALFLELKNMGSSIKTMNTKDIEDEKLNEIMNDLTAVKGQGWGWLLFITGALLMIGYAFYGFINSIEMTTFEKVGFGLLGAGGLLLFLSVLRQRLVALKKDKYKDVQL